MSTARNIERISVEDYLAGELNSTVRHEYVAGNVFAMVGARNSHNRIASNVQGAFYSQLRGKPCQEFGADTKIRIQMSDHLRFYYPDVSVVCEPNPLTDTFQDHPVVIVEVLSDSTRRADVGEKRDAYLTIPSLTHYILLEQDTVSAVVVEPTTSDPRQTTYHSLDDRIPLPSIDAELSLRDAYEGAIAAESARDD